MTDHEAARQLIAEGSYPEALSLLMGLLDDDPNDAQALFLMGNIMIHQDKKGMAYNIFARCGKLMPDSPEVWAQYGRCQADSPEGWEASEWCFKKSLELRPDYIIPMANLASLEIQRCNPVKAEELARKCLKIDPDYNVAKSSLGFALLMQGKWEDGWKNYAEMLGHRSRPDMQYGNIPEWDGSPGKTVIVYGEQGIGDEILYSSVIPDMCKDNKVIIDCMPRLKNLFQRSFPDAFVVAERWSNSITLPEGWHADAKITMAGVPIHYRRKESDFNGRPYLKAHDGMRIQMRALLDSISDKPKIGIAWTGGTKQSRGQFRQRSLEDFLPIFSDKADYISLQYKSLNDEIEEFKKAHGFAVHHFDWITESKEMDFTAALVSELDLVISVPTSVTQLSGGLGKECWVMVPEITGWLFYKKDYSWANSIKLFHDKPMKTVREYLDKWFDRREKDAA